MKYVFPTILAVLSAGSAAVSAYTGDWRHAIYWTAATAITIVVTF